MVPDGKMVTKAVCVCVRTKNHLHNMWSDACERLELLSYNYGCVCVCACVLGSNHLIRLRGYISCECESRLDCFLVLNLLKLLCVCMSGCVCVRRPYTLNIQHIRQTGILLSILHSFQTHCSLKASDTCDLRGLCLTSCGPKRVVVTKCLFCFCSSK